MVCPADATHIRTTQKYQTEDKTKKTAETKSVVLTQCCSYQDNCLVSCGALCSASVVPRAHQLCGDYALYQVVLSAHEVILSMYQVLLRNCFCSDLEFSQ